MIFKERKIPLIILQTEALLRRLPLIYPKRPLIEKDLAKRWAGYRGEKAVEYHLSGIPLEKHLILHDLRLQAGSQYFQLDTLLLTPKYILLLEIKNISGTLYFDDIFNQLIRTTAEKEEAFPDPLLQMKRQQHLLRSWLAVHHLVELPIEPRIIISQPSTIIKTSPKNFPIKNHVMHAANLSHKLPQYDRNISRMLTYSQDFITL